MNIKKKEISLLPQFVKMDGGCALRLRYNGDKGYYYRDGGDWSVDYKIIGTVMISDSSMTSLSDKVLTPITRQEWAECNGYYAPHDFPIVGYEIDSKPSTEDKRMYLLIK